MLTGRRFRLALTDDQAALADQFGGSCRAVWNTGLAQRREYRRRGAFIGYVEQARQLAEAKRDPWCAWLSEAPSHVLQQTLRDLDRACREHGTWKLRFRSKGRTPPSFRFPDPNHIAVRRLNKRWGAVRLPKLGWVRFRWSRGIGGDIRNATVLRDGAHWFVSFCVEDGTVEVAQNGQPPVGVDRGVKVAVATSDGAMFDRATATTGGAERQRRLQHRLARQSRTSNRRKATKRSLTVLHGRVRHRRADFATQTAVGLARSHGTVVVEALNVRNMTASARGTVAAPGRNVRQKAGLNREILAKGWYAFQVKLQHAARVYGSSVVLVNPAFTSQTCHACKHVAAESRESQAVFACVACGHRDHADVNAAKNILTAAGLAVAGRGDLAVGRSAKRQPPEAA